MHFISSIHLQDSSSYSRIPLFAARNRRNQTDLFIVAQRICCNVIFSADLCNCHCIIFSPSAGRVIDSSANMPSTAFLSVYALEWTSSQREFLRKPLEQCPEIKNVRENPPYVFFRPDTLLYCFLLFRYRFSQSDKSKNNSGACQNMAQSRHTGNRRVHPSGRESSSTCTTPRTKKHHSSERHAHMIKRPEHSKAAFAPSKGIDGRTGQPTEIRPFQAGKDGYVPSLTPWSL